MPYRELTADELQARLAEGADLLILDVRTAPEYAQAHLPGSRLIPLDELALRYTELDPERETVVVCARGIRSAAVALWLSQQAGFDRCHHLRGGLMEWTGPIETGPPT